MKKLTGSDIVAILETSSKDEQILKEAQNLTLNDFDTDDLCVKMFHNTISGGFKNSALLKDKKIVASTISLLTTINNEVNNYALRKAYSLVKSVNSSDNEAVFCENKMNDHIDTGIQAQIKAAKLINFLSKYISGHNNKSLLCEAYDKVNKGELDSASEKVKQVFSNVNNIQNVKVAFTTVKNQIGEAYQLCPKGIYIWGQPRPMAVSHCREYCIDSRLNPDGTVGCNYLKWLNDNLITQEQAKNLFDTIKVAHDTMNLEKGQRTKFPMSDQDPQDTHIVRNDNLVIEPWETQLNKIHDKAVKKPEKPKSLATDSAIELLLKDSRDVFDEEDLETLEIEIRKALGQ